MPTEKQNDNPEQNPQDIPQDADLFADDAREELTERQLFVGDDDFYQSLQNRPDPVSVPAAPAAPAADEPQPQLRKKKPLLSKLQKLLLAAIVITVAMLTYTLIYSPTDRRTAAPPEALPLSHNTDLQIKPADTQTPRPNAPSFNSQYADLTKPGDNQPASLKLAHHFFQQKDYDRAYDTYARLLKSIPQNEQNNRDFLNLKMALCRFKSQRCEEADTIFNTTAASASPIVRLMTNYHRISLDMQRKQYLNARKRAYLAIALIAAVDIDAKTASALRSNCYFLIAEAMTRNLLSLTDKDAQLPGNLWSVAEQIDPFEGLDNDSLDKLLDSGADYLGAALLSPQIRKIKHEDGSILWAAVCNGAPIEELLARFAANAQLDVSWIFTKTENRRQTTDIAHTRPVVLYMPVASQQQLIAAAAGQVGLLASLNNENTINVYRPDKFSSLSQHIDLLSNETVALWQKFLLTFQADKRTPNAHFALALLYAADENIPDAIAEYKLVANRFAWSSLAPYALLNSGKLKSSPNVKDYTGAKYDLEQLVTQYPDSEVTTYAYRHLAEYTEKAGLIDDAAKIYQKVYNLGLSQKSQSIAALGAGKCCFQVRDYQAAAKWLTLHIDLIQNQKSPEACSAYSLLGKTYLRMDKPQQACLAFQHALDGPLPREQYVETVSALIQGYVDQGQFIRALNTIENVDFWQFSQTESVKVLLLKSKILRDMGLTDNAVTLLRDQAEYISDSQLKAEITFEIANCYITQDRLQLAREELTNLLPILRPGPLAYETAITLADVCESLGRDEQVVSVCSQLLNSDLPEQTRNRAATMLAMAYSRRRDYDNAALALLDKKN